MSRLLIQDYLQMQGLRLAVEEVCMAQVALQAVMNVGEASIERRILWYANDEAELAGHIEEHAANEALLKQIFMALDSVCSRAQVQSAVVYALMPSESGDAYLLRLAQQGVALEQKIMLDEENGWRYLPVRAAQTGWLNIANDVSKWLALEEIRGEHHGRSGSQMALPVCTANGSVLGVVQVEHQEKEAFDEAAQAAWVGLAVALAEPMRALLRGDETDEEQADE